MPVDDGSGVLVGEICESCIHLRPIEGVAPCPYGNSQWPDKKTVFVGEDGTPGSKCHQYVNYDDIGIEAGKTGMKKQASKMSESELNVNLYRKVLALDEKNRNKLFHYWDYLFPNEYAKQMVTDEVETGGVSLRKKKIKHKKKEKKEDK
jgi:hypothetical protein